MSIVTIVNIINPLMCAARETRDEPINKIDENKIAALLCAYVKKKCHVRVSSPTKPD